MLLDWRRPSLSRNPMAAWWMTRSSEAGRLARPEVKSSLGGARGLASPFLREVEAP